MRQWGKAGSEEQETGSPDKTALRAFRCAVLGLPPRTETQGGHGAVGVMYGAYLLYNSDQPMGYGGSGLPAPPSHHLALFAPKLSN